MVDGLVRIENNYFVELPNSGWVADVGCLNWNLSRFFAERGARVLALDPNPDLTDPGISNVVFENVALVGDDSEELAYVAVGNQTGNHLTRLDFDLERLSHTDPNVFRGTPSYHTVRCSNLTKLMRKHGIEQFEVVKLNCEGSEHDILLNWPGPIARQITFDFHEHLRLGAVDCDAVFARLSEWYKVVHHTWCGSWHESLVVLK